MYAALGTLDAVAESNNRGLKKLAGSSCLGALSATAPLLPGDGADHACRMDETGA
jgi:hypothetical protein